MYANDTTRRQRFVECDFAGKMKRASKHVAAATSSLSERVNYKVARLKREDICWTSSHLPALQGGVMMLCSADTEVE